MRTRPRVRREQQKSPGKCWKTPENTGRLGEKAGKTPEKRRRARRLLEIYWKTTKQENKIEEMQTEEIIPKLKEQLIEALNLEEITPDDIDADAPLFGDGLGLDSIDALEIILILEKNYGIRLENTAEAKPHFYSVRTLAEYIAANSKQ